jgi:hypothetical protein
MKLQERLPLVEVEPVFATFPVGSMIVCEPGEDVTIFKDGQKRTIQKGSMLEAWFRQRSK